MNELKQELTKRVMYILHWGLVEARNLALCERNLQIHDLADALETLPGELMNWKDDSLESIRFNLRTYQEKYQGESYDYLKYLGDEKPPDMF